MSKSSCATLHLSLHWQTAYTLRLVYELFIIIMSMAHSEKTGSAGQ